MILIYILYMHIALHLILFLKSTRFEKPIYIIPALQCILMTISRVYSDG